LAGWQKLIKSGSNAELTRLYVGTSVTASLGFQGTASWAVSASWAPGGSPSVSASYALTASYFDNSQIANFTQASLAVTWSFTHNLNNETPIVTVWNSDKEIVIPEKIKSTGLNSVQIFFPVSLSGYASAVNGIIPSNSSVALSASYAVTASYSPAPASASYSLTSSFNNSIFTRGGTVVDIANGITTTGSYAVWRAVYPCRLISLYGRAVGSTTSQINASKSGSSGRSYHTGSNLTLSSANNWIFANSVQNTDYGTGDTLEIIITGSSATQVAVQLEFMRI